jgi:hypothetical protein
MNGPAGFPSNTDGRFGESACQVEGAGGKMLANQFLNSSS